MQPYKDGGWEEAKVKLSKERLLVLKRDIVYEDTLANNVRASFLLLSIALACFSSAGIH